MPNAVYCLSPGCIRPAHLDAVLLLLGNIRSAGMRMPICASLSMPSAEKKI